MELTDQLFLLCRNFSLARAHGEKAVNATYDYEETTRQINEAVRTSTQASNAVKESIERVSNFVENTTHNHSL